MVTQSDLQHAITAALTPGRFVVGDGLRLEFREPTRAEISWEIFRGRLLGPTQTRARQEFICWDVFGHDATGRSAEPLLSVLHDETTGRLHVTRGILSYVWEGYEQEPNVFASREVQRWVREVIATMALDDHPDSALLAEDLSGRLFQAVVGLSRLPLTSVEAPLPQFTLGKLGYFPSLPAQDTTRTIDVDLLDLMPSAGGRLERVKLLELLLRGAADLPAVATRYGARADFSTMLLEVFDEVALSPYTDFVDRTLAVVAQMSAPATQLDFLGTLLRRLGRHLTAFDLVTFHHRGANYPDALLLDAALRAFLKLAEQYPCLLTGDGPTVRLRRRALRQGWLLRRRYEGHPVPAVPTSPGENQRVLPAPFAHLADDELLDPTRRKTQLFADDPIDQRLTPTVRELLAASVADLRVPGELRELGTALFLDRPLGVDRHPTEPDQTLLLSYVAFSAMIAEQRLRFLAQCGLPVSVEQLRPALAALTPSGVPIQRVPLPQRPGVPSLQDALRVAPDFVLLATTRRGLADFLAQYDVTPLECFGSLDWLRTDAGVLVIGGGALAGQTPHTLTILDADRQPRLAFDYDPQAGYALRRLVEYPASGLRLTQTWETTVVGWTARDQRAANLVLRPK